MMSKKESWEKLCTERVLITDIQIPSPEYGIRGEDTVRVYSRTRESEIYAEFCLEGYRDVDKLFKQRDAVLIPIKSIPDAIKALAQILKNNTTK
jgi:hypothetical protein